MKKGFTLIELLAVILILGIIALIAIPVVTKMIDQANISSFKETNQNIASVAENACATAQLKGTTMAAGYSFSSDGASSEIDVKGKLPTGGSVSTTNSCKSVVYTTNSKYCAVKTADDDEVSVGKIVDGNCSIVTKDNSYCTKDTTPGTFSGSGTENDPYLIASIEDLVAIGQMNISDHNQFAGKVFKLTTNLDFKNSCSYVNSNNTTFGDINGDGNVDGLMTELTTGAGFLPIGYNDEFLGNFNGDNHYIYNLYVNRSGSSGLFGSIYSNTGTQYMKNIRIINANITGGNQVGALVGNFFTAASNCNYAFDNIIVAANVSGNGTVGVVFGAIYAHNDSTFSNIISMGSATGNSSYTGGFAADAYTGGTFNNITNYANVTGPYTTGGIISNTNSSIISNVYNYGNIKSLNNNAGGIIGYTNTYISGYSDDDIFIKNAYNYGEIVGATDIGGIVGWYGGSYIATVQNLYNYGDVKYINYGSASSQDSIGGIYGHSGSGIMINTYNYGDIYGNNRVGGIVGNSYAMNITNSANYGNIYGQYSIGGIAGAIVANGGSLSSLTNVLNQGNMTTKSFLTNGNNAIAGGIAGYAGDTTITNAYSTGNIAVESNNGLWSYVGGLVGRSESYNTTVNINNAYAKTNINVVNNYDSTSNGFFGGLIGYGGTPSNITNAYYGGDITTNLPTKTVGTIIADGDKTLTNVYYNNQSILNFNVINGMAINNSVLNSSWFNNTALLGNAFDYTNGIYPRIYQSGTTTLMSNQKNISY